MINPQKKENDKAIYLHGFKEGFEASLKIVWAYANDLLVEVDNIDKEKVRAFIEKLNC